MSIVSEFRTFIQRGNVLDMAVGVIIGAAFGKIVTSLVADILMPLIGIITGSVNIAGLSYDLPNPARPDQILVTLKYGNFLQTGIDFLIIAFCVFLLVKGLNTLQKHYEKEKPPIPPPEPTPQEKLLAEIRDLLKAQNEPPPASEQPTGERK